MEKKRTIRNHIVESNKRFIESIREGGGVNHFFRAITAKLLWYTLLYSVQKVILPEISSYKVITFLAGCGVLILAWETWNHVLKEHCPEWIDDILSGRIFFKLDIEQLNVYIAGLIALNAAFIFLPKMIWGNTETPIYDKKN